MIEKLDPPEDCEDGHEFEKTGEAPDGTKLFKCRICGEEEID